MNDQGFSLLGFLFDTEPFAPRWYCGNWPAPLGWTHIASDIAIGSAYMMIPALILFFTLRRPDAPFPRILYLFGLFIVLCGTTHFVEAVIFWQPVYNFSALMKVGTAIVSWLTVWSLVPAIPEALRLPGLQDMNLRLRAANEELDNFAQIVSHDLRAPLRGVRRLSEWLGESMKDADEETKDYLRQLTVQTDRMNHLIERVLAYSRAGKAGATTDEVATRPVVEEVLQALPPAQRAQVELQGDFPVLYADEIHLLQVFQNLLDNALRFAPQDSGHVVVKAQPGDRHHTFSIEDNGPGVSENMREQIFDLFQSGEAPESIHAGLGLSIVRRIIERNAGKIWLEQPERGGSRFVFTWPARRGAALTPKIGAN